MEIPEINMISNFEARMNCLRNPPSISRFFSFQVYSIRFWKWGALIFAIFATLNSVIRRLIKSFLFNLQTLKPGIEQIFEFSDDDDVSLASSDDDFEEDDEIDSLTTSFRDQRGVAEDFCIKNSFTQGQNGHLRQQRPQNISGCWAEFTSGTNVVKLWDSLGFSLNFDEDLINKDFENIVSTWDFEQAQQRNGFTGGVFNMSPLVLTAEVDESRNGVVLNGYDTRMPRGVPALFAEWQLPAAEVNGVGAGGVGHVYVRDDLTGMVTVGDIRNVRMPLDSVTKSNVELWWDVDADVVAEKFDEAS